MLSRRNLLVLMGTTLISGCSPDELHKIEPHLAELLNELSLRKWAVEMGKELYALRPEQFNSAPINELFEQHFSLLNVSNMDEFKKAVHTEIMNDFRDDRITRYEGWVFSQGESILYVLAFLFTNLKK